MSGSQTFSSPSRATAARQQPPQLSREEWLVLLDFYLKHRPNRADRDDLEILSSRIRALHPQPIPTAWRRPDGLRRELAVFRALEAPQSTSDRKTAKIARDVWNEFAADPRRLAETVAENEARLVRPSHGPVPTFGPVQQVREDGQTCVYLAIMEGPVERLYSTEQLQGRRIGKVGRTNDIERRVTELNSGFPPGFCLHWKIRETRNYATAAEAHTSEQAVLQRLYEARATLGREFFMLDEMNLEQLLSGAGTDGYCLERGKA